MASEILATRRFWPGGGYGDAAVRQLSAEWALVSELTRSSVWQEARSAWSKTRRAVKTRLMSRKLEPEEIEYARERMLGSDIASEIVDEIQGAYEDAIQFRRENPAYERPQAVEPIHNEAEAYEAIADGEAAIRMVELPGWDVICQRLIARHMAHFDLLRDCDSKDAARHKRIMLDTLWPIAEVQKTLDRAAAAVAFIRAATAQDGTDGATSPR